MRNRILILAAGKGTRMGEGNLPKVLTLLKNKPLIVHLLQELEKHQLMKPVVVVGYMAEKVRAVLDGDCVFATQYEQKGTAHAVMAARNFIKAENVLVLYGDMPFIKGESLKELMRLHHKMESVISMFTTKVPNFAGIYKPLEHYGRVVRGFDSKIVKITEFKDASTKEKEIKELNPGIYMFRTDWLWKNIRLIKNKNVQGEYYLTDLIEIAIQQNIPIESLEISPREVIGVNSNEDLALAESL